MVSGCATMLAFASVPLGWNLALFAVAASVVWFAGARLSRYAELIAGRTGIGRAFVGLVLLGGATSLPELATTVSAAWNGHPSLAAGNLLGGVAMQTALLAVVDGVAVAGALTFFTPRAVLISQGIMLILLLATVFAASATGERVSFGHVGLWSMVIAGAYLASLWFVHRHEKMKLWEPVNPPKEREDVEIVRNHLREVFHDVSSTSLALRFAAVAIVVAVAGWAVAEIGDSVANATGVSESLVGATLVALSTSLPELSTTMGAVKLGAYSMAVSNIFGGNAIDVALLLPADIAYTQGSIVEHIDSTALFLCGLAIVLTCLYLWGLLERNDRTIARLGIDSAIVLMVYVGGIAWLAL